MGALRRALTALARTRPTAAHRGFATNINQTYGAPAETFKRKVTIYSPARAACQQGKALVGGWKIHPGEQQKWENPLTGWTSTGDALSHQFNSIVNFETKEAAMKWCEKMGWEYEVMAVQRPNPKGNSIIPGAGKIGAKPKSYSDNFSSLRKGTPIWPHPGFEPAAK